jgi:hypothetical protein
MNTHTIAVVCAILGAVMTPIYLTLGVVGLKMLRRAQDGSRDR